MAESTTAHLGTACVYPSDIPAALPPTIAVPVIDTRLLEVSFHQTPTKKTTPMWSPARPSPASRILPSCPRKTRRYCLHPLGVSASLSGRSATIYPVLSKAPVGRSQSFPSAF